MTYKNSHSGCMQPVARLVWDQEVLGSTKYPDQFMKKAKIYIPTKTAMQSGIGKTKKWLLNFESRDKNYNSSMG